MLKPNIYYQTSPGNANKVLQISSIYFAYFLKLLRLIQDFLKSRLLTSLPTESDTHQIYSCYFKRLLYQYRCYIGPGLFQPKCWDYLLPVFLGFWLITCFFSTANSTYWLLQLLLYISLLSISLLLQEYRLVIPRLTSLQQGLLY